MESKVKIILSALLFATSLQAASAIDFTTDDKKKHIAVTAGGVVGSALSSQFSWRF